MPRDEIFEQVKNDVLAGLGEMFTPNADPPVVIHPDFADADLIGNDDVAAVPWIYFGRNNRRRESRPPDAEYIFDDLFRSDEPVEIHGVTLIDNTEGEPWLVRYVDWLGVATQLGLEVSWRVPVDEEHYRSGRVIDDG